MTLLDSKTLRDLTYYMPDKTATTKLADFFSLFADGGRIRLLSALAISEMCVSDIANILEMNQTTVSHQLKLLRAMNLVTYTRQGKVLYYKLTDGKINDLLLLGVEHIGY